jgi:hypothetical protein
MEPMLLVDWCDAEIQLELTESASDGRAKFKGKFQEAEAVNKNKRLYPFGVLDENIKRLMDVVEARGLVGELDHPSDSIIHFEKASHLITRLWWESNTLMGEGEILNTPHGKVLKSLINDGVRIGISSRGVGNGKVNENGVLVIGESYKLITFDAVADPSTFSAFQQKVASKKREFTVPQNIQPKNEGSSIHNINREALKALLGGIVKEHTNEIKARLG